MKFFIATLAFAFVMSISTAARAQEPELVNEIVARVNNDIITRADYLNAMQDFKEELAKELQKAGKGDAEIETEFERQKSTVLDIMIERLLLAQKAKELNIDVEAEINQQMTEIAKQNGYPNLIEFEKALAKQGIDPDTARATLRRNLQEEYVIQREVLGPVFNRLNEKDKREFYEKHKDAFTTPAEVTLSEIFLPLEGHTAAEVEQRARRLVAELRAGKNFVEAVKENSAPTRATRAQDGKMGVFKTGELNKDTAAAVSSLKVGEVTEPIRYQDGYQIIHLDERKDATLLPFSDARVQQMVARGATMERVEAARKKYVKQLRDDAFIDISKGYVTDTSKAEKKSSEK